MVGAEGVLEPKWDLLRMVGILEITAHAQAAVESQWFVEVFEFVTKCVPFPASEAGPKCK